MRWSPRKVRAGVVVAIAIPALVILLTGVLQAQPRPPFGGPKIERVWTCGKCKKEIGRGPFPPGTCPHCGAKIINGIGGGNPPMGNPNPPPVAPPQVPKTNPPPTQPVIAPAPPVTNTPPPVAAPAPKSNEGPARTQPPAPVAASGMSVGVIVVIVIGLLTAGLGLVMMGGGVLVLIMKK